MLRKILSVALSLVLVITALNYVPQTARAEQREAAGYDWSDVDFLVTEGALANEYGNRYKMVKVTGDATIDIIQNPGFTTAPGVYVTFSNADFGEITINDVATTAYSQQGAGICFHMSGFAAQYNDLVVKDSTGSVKAEFYIYDTKYSGSETESKEPESESKEPETIESQLPGTSDLSAPENVEAYNFYAQAKGYQIIFDDVAGAVSYNIYIDDVAGAITKVSASKEYISADILSAFADGALHTLYVAAVDSDGNVSVKSEATRVRVTKQADSASDPTDVSRIYVVTNSDAAITKESKTAASLTIISGESSVSTAADSGTIKLRGNSTSLADKPAYNISFSSKQTVFTNAAKGKKWCLLANAYEKTLLRNKIAIDFGRTLGSIAAPEQHYADLYLDGVYKGSYVICEPAENDRAGVSYDDSDTSNEMMFEWERDRVEDGQTYYTTGMGVRFVAADPEGLATDTSRYSNWVSTLAEFESALQNTASADVLDYMDVDSFIDMYIVNELFCTVDVGYSSIKFYVTYDSDGKPTIHAGPLWDFDLSSGNSSDEYARSNTTFRAQNENIWFRYLMQNPNFKSKVLEKYEKMQPTIQNIYKDNKLGKSRINQNIAFINASRIRNYTSIAQGGAGWSESEPDGAEWTIYRYSYSTLEPYINYTYDQHVEYLANWLKDRNEWLCEQWGIDYAAYDSEYAEDIPISRDLEITGYQMTSSFNNVEGNMGARVIYQTEKTVDGQTPEETGLVYGLNYNEDITENDIVYGSENAFVKSFASTEAGKLQSIMGDSQTASYYVMTMSCGSADDSDNITPAAYTTTYIVRAYAKFSDGSVVYSDAVSYTIYKIADYLYKNNMVNTLNTYNYLYSKILHAVDENYAQGDFDWSNTLVK